MDTYPPANYYEDSTQSTFKRIRDYLTAFSIGAIIVGWVLIPKKMHLHALSVLCLPAQILVMFGLCATGKSDWLQYTLGYIWRAAMIGGWSAGSCCDDVSEDHNITSEIVATVGLALAVMVAGWVILALFAWLQRGCCKGMNLKGLAYFVLTITLGLFFPVAYAALNALYHYSLQTPADSLNTDLGIILTILFPLLLVGLWIVTCQTVIDTGAVRRTTMHQIHVEEKEDILPLP